MLEPSSTWKGERNVVVDPVMVKSPGRDFPVRLMNVSDDTVKLYKGMHLGQCEGVTEVQHCQDESQEDSSTVMLRETVQTTQPSGADVEQEYDTS